MTAWLAKIGTKIGVWLLAIGVGAALLATAILDVFRKGEQAGAAKAAKADADAKAADAAAAKQAAKGVSEVQSDVSKLDDGGVQQVGTAKPGTPAGDLRDRGWVRDVSNHDPS